MKSTVFFFRKKGQEEYPFVKKVLFVQNSTPGVPK